MEKLPNSWTNWHQIRYTSVNSSGIGHRLKRYPRAAFWVFYGVNNSKDLEMWSNGWTDWDFAHIMQMNLGMDTGGQFGPMRHQGAF